MIYTLVRFIGFYGISTSVGYLTPNSVYTDISIRDCKQVDSFGYVSILFITFQNEPGLIFLLTVIWFQIFF